MPRDKAEHLTELIKKASENTGMAGVELLQGKLKGIIGTHFLGNVAHLTHIADNQSGGRTEIDLNYVREVDESVEYLGAIEAQQTVTDRLDEDALKESIVASIGKPEVGTTGISAGIIADVRPMPPTYKASCPLWTGTRRLATAAGAYGAEEVIHYVDTGVERPLKEYGAGVAEALGRDPEELIIFYAWRVKESVPTYRQEKVDLPAEEMIRPGWYGNCWRPDQIGETYKAVIGVGAMTDPHQVTDVDGRDVPYGPNDEDLARLDRLEKNIARRVDAGTDDDADTDFIPSGQGAIMTLRQGRSIQQAAEFLIHLYSYIKQNELSADDFITSYTWRPVASMVDMFGTSDLMYDADGKNVIQGVEGFHSKAFGPYENLFGLVDDDIESVLGFKRGDAFTKKADTRKKKLEAVLAYVAAIRVSRGLLG